MGLWAVSPDGCKLAGLGKVTGVISSGRKLCFQRRTRGFPKPGEWVRLWCLCPDSRKLAGIGQDTGVYRGRLTTALVPSVY